MMRRRANALEKKASELEAPISTLQMMGRRRQALAGFRGGTRTSRAVERMARSSFESGRVDTETPQGCLSRD
jgi:tRNA U34 5-methylaminomethyl-2-thiouridine-forming methyltransferase MnmC